MSVELIASAIAAWKTWREAERVHVELERRFVASPTAQLNTAFERSIRVKSELRDTAFNLLDQLANVTGETSGSTN